MTSPAGPHASLPTHVSHLVVGAGFAGVGLAIGLDEDGEDFLVIEKDDGLGGTWLANHYPGAACDVPSQLYSFSFALNPEWSRAYSPQPEIREYLERTAREAGVLDRFRFGVALEEAAWDADAQLWRVTTTAGELTCSVLVAAAGGLSEPRLPAIEGLESFRGSLFHTARWRDDVDLRGARVAVIGTGASAIQVVPAIQPTVGHLDVYQRTAPWVIPRADRAFRPVENRLFRRLPAVQRAYRARTYLTLELMVPGITRHQALTAPVQRMARANLAKGVADPELRERLTPHFGIFCKRILLSNDYYPALSADNVDVVTEPIARVTPDGIVTADGEERPVDVIVVATGFQATDLPIAHHVRGRGGRTLAETWAAGGMAAYKGSTVHGFPNLFIVPGPNTGQGHTSMIVMIEAQIGYLREALRVMRQRRIGALEPRAEVQRRWNAELQRRMRSTVWLRGGCTSWYLDDHGRNTTLWPRSTVSFRRLLRRFDVDAYDVAAPVGVPAHAGEGLSA